MPRFVVSHTGQAARSISAATWLEALGTAMAELGALDDLQALACEVLPNGSIVARDVKTGQGFAIHRGDSDVPGATPAPVSRRQRRPSDEPFGVHNLARSVFRENLKHELRGPIDAILGYAELLREEAQDRALYRMEADLEQLAASARGLLELIDAGLEAQRVADGDVEVHRLTFGVVELLHDAAAAFAPEARRRGNAVEVDARGNLGEMRGDPQVLRGALMEILRWNSHRVKGGVLTLDAVVEVDEDNAEWIRLRVSDSGPPISTEESQALFQVLPDQPGRRGTAAATLRRATFRARIRKQGGDLDLMPGPEGRPVLGIHAPRGR